MSWQCPSCGFNENDDETLRCSCGHENIVYDAPNYNKIDGGLMFVASGLVISMFTILSSSSDAVAFAKDEDKITLLVFGAIIFIIPMALLILLFKRKRSFPRYIKLWYIANLIMTYVNMISIKSSPNTPEKIQILNSAIDVLALTSLSCCVWLTYFFFPYA